MMLRASVRAAMQKTQESTMDHTCVIEHYIVAEDGTVSYGTPSDGIKCGFHLTNRNSDLSYNELYETMTSTAELRLPLGVEIGMKDRVTITQAYGESRGDLHFEVNRLPSGTGPSGQVIGLQEIYL